MECACEWDGLDDRVHARVELIVRSGESIERGYDGQRQCEGIRLKSDGYRAFHQKTRLSLPLCSLSHAVQA